MSANGGWESEQFLKLIEHGTRKGYFTIRGDEITYPAQRYSDSFGDPEEKVRVGIFYDLIEKSGYENRKQIIDFEVERTIGHPDKKTKSLADILLYQKDETPYALFELKAETDYERYFEDSIKTQLFERAAIEDKGSGALKYLIYYTRFYEDGELFEKMQTIDYTLYKTWEQWEGAGRPNLRVIPAKYGIVDKPPRYIKDSPTPGNRLRDNVKKDELDRIADDLHNVLWGGGQHQNELFFNLIGLFLTKIFDEKIHAYGESYDFQILFEGDRPEAPAKTYERINRLYRGRWDEDDSKYSQCALSYLLGYDNDQLRKTPDIVFDANKVAYVVETLQGISFTKNKYDVLGDFFEKIVRTELKQTKGQYLTHHNIVDFVVAGLQVSDLAIDLINGKDGPPRLPYIIDPACGSGTFQIQCMKEITRTVLQDAGMFKRLRATDDVEQFIAVNFPDAKQNVWAQSYIYGIEINPDLAMATKVNMVGHGDGSANIHAADGLTGFAEFSGGSLLNRAAASPVYPMPVNENFDVVLSNPPFSVVVDKDTAKQFPHLYVQGDKIAKSLKKESKKEVDTENLFIERWYQLLREKGRLGVVLPDSVFDTTSNRPLRLLLFKYFWIKAVVSLPTLAFAPYTTTKTSLLFAQKKTNEEVAEWNARWIQLEGEYGKIRGELAKLRKRKLSDELQPEFLDTLRGYLLSLYEPGDDELSIAQLKAKYEDDMKQVDNDWWVFSKITGDIDYRIFMAHAEEIGYKRGVSRIEARPNHLFSEKLEDESRMVVIDRENPTSILDQMLSTVEWE